MILKWVEEGTPEFLGRGRSHGLKGKFSLRVKSYVIHAHLDALHGPGVGGAGGAGIEDGRESLD